MTRSLPSAYVDAVRDVSDVDVWEDPSPPSRSDLLHRSAAADVLLTSITESVDDELLSQLPTLRGISNLAVGFDNIDLEACQRRGVAVTNVPGSLDASVAELTIGLILAVSRRLHEAASAARYGDWGPWDPFWMCGHDLEGRTLGIVGPGRIGRRVARLGRAFGMAVVEHSRTSATTLENLLDRADVISVHVPLTPDTHHLLSRREFRRAKRGAIIINTSRGDIIDHDALLEAITSGHLGGAGLDVVSPEPIPTDHPLLHCPNVVITPHIGSATDRTRRTMIELAVSNARDLLSGRPCPNLVTR